jgi:2-oxoglutarate dehydrogenase E2 component (dihydrolipoamide succinyltransferase)
MQGRITKDDIQNFISQHGQGAAAPAQRPAAAPTYAAPSAPSPPQAAPTFMAAGGGAPSQAPSGVQVPVWPGDRVEPMSKMRSIIAQRMVESKHTSAHVHTVFKVDMTRIVKIREKQKNSYEQRNGVKLTYMPFVARAVMAGIKAMPIVNSSVAGDSIVFHKNVNLGIAVALDWGLIVPVVKQAEEKSFLGLARGIADVAERARGKKLQPDEVQGGTFTITNPGIFGPQFGTPIINQPQVAILGMGGMFKEPVVVTDENGNDSIAIRSIIRLTLGYDHRIIDGADADRFMVAVRKYLEEWSEEIG